MYYITAVYRRRTDDMHGILNPPCMVTGTFLLCGGRERRPQR